MRNFSQQKQAQKYRNDQISNQGFKTAIKNTFKKAMQNKSIMCGKTETVK